MPSKTCALSKAFRRSRCAPDDLESLDDPAKFPFTCNSDLRDNCAGATSGPAHAQPHSQLIGSQLPAQTLDVRLCRCNCSACACLIGCGRSA